MTRSRRRPLCVGCGEASTPLQCDRVRPNTGRVCAALLCRDCAHVVRPSRVVRFVTHHCPICAAAEREAALATSARRVFEAEQAR
jgi:hypothetical protein